MKRRYIVYILIAAVVGLASLITMPQTIAVINQQEDIKTEDVKDIIVIDPGHGGFDSGAIGRFTRVHEDDLNLAVALKLKKIFEDNGYEIIMTRKDEEAVGYSKDGDMWTRRSIIDKSGADIVISIHMNKFSDSRVAGPMAFYFKGSEEGGKLARFIQAELNAALKPYRPRSHKPETYYILRSGKCPCVLVECGFISNEREERLLQTEQYQMDTAYAIYIGAVQYLDSRFVTDVNEDIDQ